MYVELLVSFLIGFFAYWFVSRTDIPSRQKLCPMKDSIVWLAENYDNNSKKMTREIREYSLIKIGEGHYEYADVLETLIKKDKNDKS